MKTGQEKVHNFRQEIARDWPNCWPHPTTLDSWVFLVTEVGEVGDALIRQGYGERSAYSRNRDKHPDLQKELGDVYLMLCTLATHLGVDLDEALDEVIYALKRKHNGNAKLE